MLTNPSTGCGNTTTNPLMDFHRNPWSDRPKHWTMQTWWNVNRESFTQLLPDISLYIWHAKHIWAVWLLGRRICFSGHNWFKVTKGFIVVEQQQQQQRQQQQQQQEQDFHKCRKKNNSIFNQFRIAYRFAPASSSLPLDERHQLKKNTHRILLRKLKHNTPFLEDHPNLVSR